MKNRFYLFVMIIVASLMLGFACSATAAEIEVGDTLLLGSTLQESLHGGPVYGTAPIEWTVLARENDRVLLITKQAVCYKPYGGSNWANSSLRSYLNEEFYEYAFTEEEKSVIIPVTVPADQNPMYDSDQGDATTDRVFILSIEEAKAYLPTIGSRCCTATAYVNGEGAFRGVNGNCNWLLRTRGIYSSDTTSVFSFGAIDYFGRYIYDESFAIRPALWIDTGSDEWKNLELIYTSLDDQALGKIHTMDLTHVDMILNTGRDNSSSEENDQRQEEAKNTEEVLEQIRLIYASKEYWERDSSTHMVMYAVTDLDHNGRLEIITAENYSSGNYTHLEIWEVDEDRSALVNLGSGIDNNFMLTYGSFDNDILRDDVCAPDILPDRFGAEPITETNAYSLAGEDRIYYTFQNFSGNIESWDQIQESLFLEKGEVHVFPVAWRVYDGSGTTRFYDYQGNVIGPQQYGDWDSFFEGYRKNVVRLYWFWNSTCSIETMMDSYNVFSHR